ncbi:thiolase family protein [Gordonia McavH-238-E]|uniref:thiolase family protein n=1 Tax=Gordonia sp. McavH-238-E TaxID=2917736 RepID=UPI001EF706B6|nr:thiolase family protein [Gordonia sp. McavH-238-E]MCG7633281.1 thiolase family protein [Gordonia sp. McavH-238-E]
MTDHDIAIVGVGETDYVRRDDRPLATMIAHAVHAALRDAGLTVADVDGMVSESAQMPHHASAEDVGRAAGITHDLGFVAYGAGYGAGLVSAPRLAEMALASGQASVVVCWFGHRLSAQHDGPRSVHADDDVKATLEMPYGWYGQPVYFAAMTQRYAHEFGLPTEALASVSMEAHRHALTTPGAMRPRPMTIESYLDTPMVAEPLRSADCCLVNDGATAFVMTALDRARDLAKPVVRVAGVGLGRSEVSGVEWFTQNNDYLVTPASVSGPRAFRDAGLRPSDVDFLEAYDCFSINTILQFEDLGFAPKGEGASFAIEKGIGLGDRLPTNTHGGLLAHSFMLGANHVVEAVRQLRGERGDGQVPGAEVGMVTALGVPHHASMLLTAER